MEFNAKSCILAKTIVTVFIGTFFTQCNNKINCDEINEKTTQLINQYYFDNNNEYLDSIMFYLDKGINKCDNCEKILSLRKLSILAEQQNFSEAIKFVKTFDKEMFSDLPYYQELLINRFKVMEAIRENDINTRDRYLAKCVVIIDNYLLANKQKVDSLLKQPNIENILKNPLSTALTQYYYYKSTNNINGILKDLNKKKREKNINNEFIDYLIDYLQTDFMEFNGI